MYKHARTAYHSATISMLKCNPLPQHYLILNLHSTSIAYRIPLPYHAEHYTSKYRDTQLRNSPFLFSSSIETK